MTISMGVWFADTGGGNQDLTISGFGTVEACLLFAVHAEAVDPAKPNRIANDLENSYGAIVNTGGGSAVQGACGITAEHKATARFSGSWSSDAHCIGYLNYDRGFNWQGYASFSAWTTDGVTISWGDNPTTEGAIIGLFFGGSAEASLDVLSSTTVTHGLAAAPEFFFCFGNWQTPSSSAEPVVQEGMTLSTGTAVYDGSTIEQACSTHGVAYSPSAIISNVYGGFSTTTIALTTDTTDFQASMALVDVNATQYSLNGVPAAQTFPQHMLSITWDSAVQLELITSLLYLTSTSIGGVPFSPEALLMGAGDISGATGVHAHESTEGEAGCWALSVADNSTGVLGDQTPVIHADKKQALAGWAYENSTPALVNTDTSSSYSQNALFYQHHTGSTLIKKNIAGYDSSSKSVSLSAQSTGLVDATGLYFYLVCFSVESPDVAVSHSLGILSPANQVPQSPDTMVSPVSVTLQDCDPTDQVPQTPSAFFANLKVALQYCSPSNQTPRSPNVFQKQLYVSLQNNNPSWQTPQSPDAFLEQSRVILQDCDPADQVPQSPDVFQTQLNITLQDCDPASQLPQSPDVFQKQLYVTLQDCDPVNQVPQSPDAFIAKAVASVPFCDPADQVPQSPNVFQKQLSVTLQDCDPSTQTPRSPNSFRSVTTASALDALGLDKKLQVILAKILGWPT